MQTVKAQLMEALERLLNEADVPEAHADCLSTESGPCNCVFARGRAALDRARAEPKEGYSAPTGQPTPVHCTDCGCYEAGYQAGLEAQRERGGRA